MERLYRENYKIVYGYLLALCGDPDWAEDLAAETFLKAIQSIGRYDGKCRMSTWLCAIGRNLYFNERKVRKRHVPLEQVILSEVNSMEETYMDAEQARQISAMIEELEEPRKQLFLMRLQGLPYSQIAGALGKSETWARVTFFRTKNEIVERLEGKK